MPVKGVILIVIVAIIIAVANRGRIYEWLEPKADDDGIDDNNFKED